MAIKGSLREASLPDVLQLLALGQKTGCLAVTDRSSFGYIYFERGSISYASILNRRDRLGDLLVKNALLDPEVLASAIEAQDSRSGKRLGEILIERGAISREQLEHYIRVQIEEAVYFLFTWTQGSFYFEVDQRPEEGAMLVSINPESLLLEGARRVDEWSLIEKKIPSFDVIFALDPGVEQVPGDELSQEQRKLLPLIDGKRSVREVVDESGMVEFEVGKALFGLVQAGLAHPKGKKAQRAAEESPARVQEHRNLGIAFYRTGMYEEAVREFKRVAELQPGDLEAPFFIGLVALRTADPKRAVRRFMEVVEGGGRWAGAFHGLALALEMLGRHGDALLTIDEALEIRPNRPDALLSRAILLAKSGRMDEAVEAFERYREGLGDDRPSAAYYAFAVATYAARGRLERAAELGEEGIEPYGHVPELLLHLGAVRERQGSWEQAEMLYRRAVEEGQELPQAHKSLGDALYRRTAYDDAAESFARAIALAPEAGDDAHFKLGNIHYKRGEREDAVRCWREALRLNPEHPVARTNLELVERVMSASGP
jgi:tetratricopeptide (TPR) repeat protein